MKMLGKIHNTISKTMRDALPWLCLLAVYVAAITYSVKFGCSILDSDMASEMILANILNQKGEMLTTDWYYPNELRVVYLQWVFRPALLLFPHNWHAARVFALAILMILVVVSFLYFAVTIVAKKTAVYTAAALLCPFGFWYAYLVIYGASYMPHIILGLLGVGAVLHILLRKSKKWLAFHGVILLFAAIGAGLNGVRLLMNIYVPLFLATSLIVMFRIHLQGRTFCLNGSTEGHLLAVSMIALEANVAGYLINSKWLSANYAFLKADERYWSSLSISAMLDCWSDFFSLFGFQMDEQIQNISNIPTAISLFSLPGIVSFVGLFLAGIVFASAVRLLFRFMELNLFQQILVGLFWCSFFINGIIFSSTYGTINANATYWVPLLPFALAVLSLEIELENFCFLRTRIWVTAGIGMCILGVSVVTAQAYRESPLRAIQQRNNISEWLLNHDYSEGYATFWESNVLTELSDGRIETWTVKDLEKLEIYECLQTKEHKERKPTGRIFVLFGPNDTRPELMPYYIVGGVERSLSG